MKSLRKKCEQQWDSSHATSTSKALRHKEVCVTLDSSIEFTLNDKCKCNKETNEGKLCNSKKPSQSKPDQKPSSKTPCKPSSDKHSSKTPSKNNDDTHSQSKCPPTNVFQATLK